MVPCEEEETFIIVNILFYFIYIAFKEWIVT